VESRVNPASDAAYLDFGLTLTADEAAVYIKGAAEN